MNKDPHLAKAFGTVVMTLRRLHGWSQETFAKKVDISRTSPGRHERGEWEPRMGTLIWYAAVLATDPRTVLDLTLQEDEHLANAVRLRHDPTSPTGQESYQYEHRTTLNAAYVRIRAKFEQECRHPIRDIAKKQPKLGEAFGAVLVRLRQHRGLSQDDLAEAADADRTTPSLYERGIRSPTLASFVTLSRVLEIHPVTVLHLTLKEQKRLLAEPDHHAPHKRGRQREPVIKVDRASAPELSLPCLETARR